ncbi:hypothetical protein POV27_18420 [Aureisphaera galaxeae]|uniref:hypothetical protein n=1 Tax=Aureisphaera galaxeae TaxID=1538023 RepID=UPI0023505CF6|nr:hypothetical protein [Aureisphaera galaxeae]MDC8006033.1 hypothetical protein [Aureisphaera galaxeae]
MNNTFEFGELFGIESPLTISTSDKKDITGFYNGKINFETLVEDIKVSKTVGLLQGYSYKDYVSNTTSTVEVTDRETLEVHSSTFLVDVPFKFIDSNQKERALRLYGALNKKDANVRTDIYVARTSIDLEKKKVSYNILFVYEGFDQRKNNTDKSDINRVALAISTNSYDDYHAAYDYLAYKRSQVEQEVLKKYTTAFLKAEQKVSQLAFLYREAPEFVLQNRDDDLKWGDLYLILDGLVTNNKEKAIIRLLRSLAIDYSLVVKKDEVSENRLRNRINNFFYRLSLKGQNGSLFEKLYKKINDYGIGDDNFTLFIQELYKFWSLSDFANPNYTKNQKQYTGGPEVLLYDTNKVLGFYNNDYSFDFVTDKSRLKIKVTKEETRLDNTKTNPGKGGPKLEKEIKDIGKYNIFHPITLANVPKEGEIKIPTNVIPAFYLKAFDDKQRWSNVDKGIWLGVDVVTTITGFGNLLKLRHLRHLTKLGLIKPNRILFNIKTAVSIAEITSGTLNAMLTLADSDSPFANKLREYLFWLEMVSLGSDVLVERLLRKSARETLDVGEDLLYSSPNNVKKKELEQTLYHLAQIVEESADYSSRFARTFSKAVDKVSAKIKKFEDKIRNLDVEDGMILNNARKIEIKHQGKKYPDYIDWSHVPSSKFKGSTLTHNHPNSSGLSLADVKVFLNFELREIRAIGKNGTIFSMINVGITTKRRKDLLDLIDSQEAFARQTFTDAGTYFQEAYVFRQVYDAMKGSVDYVKYIE